MTLPSNTTGVNVLLWSSHTLGTVLFDDLNLTMSSFTPTVTPTPTPTPIPHVFEMELKPPKPITVQISATADTYTSSASPSTNYGTSHFIYVDSGREGYFKYDLSSTPSATIISSAELHDYISWSRATGSANIFAVTGAWNETGINWNNKPANESVALGVYDIPISTTGIGDCEHVTSGFENIVQRWVNGSLDNNGIMITTPNKITSSELDSKESAFKPYLFVTYVPVGDYTLAQINTRINIAGGCVGDIITPILSRKPNRIYLHLFTWPRSDKCQYWCCIWSSILGEQYSKQGYSEGMVTINFSLSPSPPIFVHGTTRR